MKKVTQNYIKYQLPWQLLMLIIFIISSIGNKDLPDLQFRESDKLAHFFVFGLLGILLYRGFLVSKRPVIRLRAVSLSLLVGILYGLFDEVHQYFVPGRFASITDWIADITGIIVMIYIFRLFHNKLYRAKLKEVKSNTTNQ